jgi:hypothetical protein
MVAICASASAARSGSVTNGGGVEQSSLEA